MKNSKLLKLQSFVTVLLSLLGTDAEGSFMAEQMDHIYQQIMTERTDPGAYKTARRGVLSGGQIRMRNRIADIHPLTIEPPSISAGCGGINLFTGSFSFINSEQWIQFARSVASNAASYAFELALEEMSPSIHAVVSKLQAAANMMNGYQLNSCQLAQGIVNDTIGQALDNRARTDASIYSSVLGYFDDYFTARNGSNGDGKSQSVAEIARNNPELYSSKLGGNIVYNALLESGAVNWFADSGNFATFAAEVMSVMGTVIAVPEELPDGNVEQRVLRKAPTMIFSDLVEGDSNHPVYMYRCVRDYAPGIPCTELTSEKTIEYIGMSARFQDLLLGRDRLSGIVGKFVSESIGQTELTPEEQSFLSMVPEIAVQIRNLSQSGNFALVRDHVMQNSDAIGAMAAFNLIENIYRSTRIALSSSRNSNRDQALVALDDNMKNFRREFEIYSAAKGGLDSGSLYRSYRDRKRFIGRQYNRTWRFAQ